MSSTLVYTRIIPGIYQVNLISIVTTVLLMWRQKQQIFFLCIEQMTCLLPPKSATEQVNIEPLNHQVTIHYGRGTLRLALSITLSQKKSWLFSTHTKILADQWYPNIGSQFNVWTKWFEFRFNFGGLYSVWKIYSGGRFYGTILRLLDINLALLVYNQMPDSTVSTSSNHFKSGQSVFVYAKFIWKHLVARVLSRMNSFKCFENTLCWDSDSPRGLFFYSTWLLIS